MRGGNIAERGIRKKLGRDQKGVLVAQFSTS